MKIFYRITEIKTFLREIKKSGKTIGFVPTMGALHQGHLSLIENARKNNDIVVCSIFVNPIQFNNKTDLEKYPRPIEKDIKMLEGTKCDVVFIPSEKEMYPVPDKSVFDFGMLDKVMEGKHRPGHFNGVAIVVKKLFEIIEPDNAYFGEKDFQQLSIIKKIVQLFDLKVKIIPCATLREKDGLAMSSRNIHLSPEERKSAANIYKILSEIKNKIPFLSVEETKQWVEKEINATPFLQLEYIEIADSEKLQAIKDWKNCTNCRAFIAVKAGKTRLIDNMSILL